MGLKNPRDAVKTLDETQVRVATSYRNGRNAPLDYVPSIDPAMISEREMDGNAAGPRHPRPAPYCRRSACCPERTVALRKLLEAKDAAVRAVAIPEIPLPFRN